MRLARTGSFGCTSSCRSVLKGQKVLDHVGGLATFWCYYYFGVIIILVLILLWPCDAQRCRWSHPHLDSGMSRKGSCLFDSFSIVNCILGLILFRWLRKEYTRSKGRAVHVLLAYLLQNLGGGVWKVDSASRLTSSMTTFANSTDTGDPIAVPWICRYTLPLKG